MNAEVAPYITNMSQRKIHEIISGFGKAAVLAKQAGFDMMQVHGDRMCGSFSSAIFNHRTDEYGGSAENRARFAAEAVSAVHAAVPGMPIDYKLAVRQENPHFGNAGVVEEDLPVFVPLLEQAGVTSFHVTLANHSALENTIPPADHPYFSQPGCFLKFCDEVRQYTDLPSVVSVSERPGSCGAAARQRTHPVRRHEPPASGRPGLGEQAEKRAGGTDPPLSPLQQEVSGRADGTSGDPLCL